MADDLDDLLNEVESKYCSSNKSRTRSQGSERKYFENDAHSKQRKQTTSKDKDLNDMIDDIFDDDDLSVGVKHMKVSPRKSDPGTTNRPRRDSTGTGRKCFPVFLGGPNSPSGISSTINHRACDNLRCTDCDFEVSIFAGYCWHSSIDYLFLRNNMPDFDRLKPKLVKKKGSSAYACQCKSRTVNDLVDLQSDYELKWVCGKH